MKTSLIIAVTLTVVACQFDEEWQAYKKIHGRNFTSAKEENEHLQTFRKRFAQIKKHNELYKQGKVTYRQMVNNFTDIPHDKITSGYNGFRTLGPVNVPKRKLISRTGAPKSFDWREHGVTTPVKNQMYSRTCWAFAAVGAMEGQEMIRNYRNLSFSEQNIIDCLEEDHTLGGHMEYAYNYTRDNQGLSIDMYYEYTGYKGDCIYKPAFNAGSYAKGYKRLPFGDENALKEAVANIGPVSAAIDATLPTLSAYYEGIYFDEDCKSDLDSLTHAVLVVGYGTENGHDYWIIKNSMGKYWGQKGYFKLARNKKNHCGIASEAMYPIMRFTFNNRIQG